MVGQRHTKFVLKVGKHSQTTHDNLCFDGVTKRDGHYHAVYLTNNEFALEFVVPDAPWLDADVRANLEAHAGDWGSYVKAPPF